MSVRRTSLPTVVLGLLFLVGLHARAQGPSAPQTPPVDPAAAGRGRAAGPGQGAPPGRGGGRATFPAQQRALADPAQIERGRSLYSVSCTACHGGDLRGGQLGGPNLLRSAVVLGDDLADQLGPILQGGRADKGMPPIPTAPDDVKALAAYLHSVLATARGQGAPPPGPPVVLNIVVGDPAAGATYFSAKCASCHSATGDLQGLATRIPDPKAIQNLWVAGGSGRGNATRRTVTVVVTLPTGVKAEGRLIHLDDFIVTLAAADGRVRSFRRDGEVPRVEVTDPLAGHRALLPTLTNKDMHDVTAYLVTLK